MRAITCWVIVALRDEQGGRSRLHEEELQLNIVGITEHQDIPEVALVDSTLHDAPVAQALLPSIEFGSTGDIKRQVVEPNMAFVETGLGRIMLHQPENQHRRPVYQVPRGKMMVVVSAIERTAHVKQVSVERLASIKVRDAEVDVRYAGDGG